MQTVVTSKKFEDELLAKFIVENLDERQNSLGLEDDLAVLYFGFPKFYGYEDIQSSSADLILLSKHHGVLALRFPKINQDSDAEDMEDEWDEFRSLIFTNLYDSKLLRSKNKRSQELNIPFDAFYYIDSSYEVEGEYSELFLSSFDELEVTLLNMRDKLREPLSDIQFNECRAIIEGTKALSTGGQRSFDISQGVTKAFTLAKLEEEIKNFDFNQRNSAVSIIDGPQRIRGLAGSGKTVVLAMKAAHIHMEEPDKKILFTFYTKSLYEHVKNLITRFYRHYKKVDPNWDNLHIKHAWGGAGIDGVYYSACINNGIATYRFQDAKDARPNNPFEYVCEKAIASNKLREEYDYVLMDEAQDMTAAFFKLVYCITKGDRDRKNIIWGYDELQNIFKVKTRSPSELFGKDNDGIDYVDLDRASANLPTYLSNDIVLKKCYRNPKEILLCAHALGFGLYREDGIPVQNLEDAEHWKDVGYEIIDGDFNIGSRITLERPDKNSPLSISKYESINNIIQYQSFENTSDETDWIIKNIKDFLSEGLKPEDIMIIALDDRYAKIYFNQIGLKLNRESIDYNNVLLNPYNSKSFIEKNQITMSTIHRAKGNEAPAIIVLGIDALYSSRDSRFSRNRIFTALTRAKAWLRVSGIGEKADYFFNEFNSALERSPRLVFTQPDPQQIETLQRDLSEKSQQVRKLRKEFEEQLELIGLSEEEQEQFFKGKLR